MMSALEQHLTVYVDRSLYNKSKKKVSKSKYALLLKEMVAAGLILTLDKDEESIRRIIKNFRKGGDK